MATEETVTVHPGDVVQDHEGLLYLTTGVHSWGIGAVMRWQGHAPEMPNEVYHRLMVGSFRVVGVAPLMPEAVAQSRRDSLTTEKARKAEGLVDPDDLTPMWDVEVRFNGRTTGAGQKHTERVRADCVEQALEAVRHPVGNHGGAICIVGVTVDEVRRETGK